MSLKVKICGITTHDALEAAISCHASYVGFVYHPASPRHVPLEKAAALISALPASVASVLVCVDPEDAQLDEISQTLSPSYLQLHGAETPERVAEIKETYGIPIIRALGVRQAEDLEAAEAYASYANMLLLDARSDNPDIPGGTGHCFDWSLLAGHHFPLPWILSGGLNEGNLSNAVHMTGATMVDVSSGVEKSRGVKDPLKIRSFLTAAHTLEMI